MSFARLSVAATLALSSLAAQAATVIPVTQDGSWYAFDVNPLDTPDSNLNWNDASYLSSYAGNTGALSFTFTVADKAILKLVDIYTAGDTYNVAITSASGTTTYTSSVANFDLGKSSLAFTSDYDAAFADPVNFSQLQLTLSAGTYTVTGSLLQSVIDSTSGTVFNSTSGGLSVTAVPEPTSLALMLAAAGVMGVVSRRRAQA